MIKNVAMASDKEKVVGILGEQNVPPELARIIMMMSGDYQPTSRDEVFLYRGSDKEYYVIKFDVADQLNLDFLEEPVRQFTDEMFERYGEVHKRYVKKLYKYVASASVKKHLEDIIEKCCRYDAVECFAKIYHILRGLLYRDVESSVEEYDSQKIARFLDSQSIKTLDLGIYMTMLKFRNEYDTKARIRTDGRMRLKSSNFPPEFLWHVITHPYNEPYIIPVLKKYDIDVNTYRELNINMAVRNGNLRNFKYLIRHCYAGFNRSKLIENFFTPIDNQRSLDCILYLMRKGFEVYPQYGVIENFSNTFSRIYMKKFVEWSLENSKTMRIVDNIGREEFTRPNLVFNYLNILTYLGVKPFTEEYHKITEDKLLIDGTFFRWYIYWRNNATLPHTNNYDIVDYEFEVFDISSDERKATIISKAMMKSTVDDAFEYYWSHNRKHLFSKEDERIIFTHSYEQADQSDALVA